MSEPFLSKSPHAIPDEKTLSEAYSLPVLSQDGKSVQFRDLVAPGNGVSTVVVIFIRHFFCSCDQDYIRSLQLQLTPTILSTRPPPIGPARLVIVGCGDPSRILPYIAETCCEFPVFTDPTRRIYKKLQMKMSLSISAKPSYMKHSLISLIITSVRQMIGSGFGVFRGGNYVQNGGEWIFVAGKCEWVHRMDNTSDHLTAEELAEVLNG